MKTLLTGGGTAGHVIPNIALLPHLSAHELHYIGSHSGVERGLIEAEGIPYYAISSGKLRRYLSAENLKDAFRVTRGVSQARRIIKRIKPNVVFSKGGFVAVPVVIAAKLSGIPVVIHESDITMGLANKICAPFATKICCSFAEVMSDLSVKKAQHTGTPIREEIFAGSAKKGAQICAFPDNKPVLLAMGGSLGAQAINTCLQTALPQLISKFNIIHITGKGHLYENLHSNHLRLFEYIGENMADILAYADIVVSRAGSNAINELLAIAKPNLLIPLSRAASRGDQILNAQSFEKLGYSRVLQEEELSPDRLKADIYKLFEEKERYISAMKKSPVKNGIAEIVRIIEGAAK